MNAIQVLILNEYFEVRQAAVNALMEMENIHLLGTTDSSEEVLKRLENELIDVLLIGSEVDGDGYAVCRKITSANPNQAVIMLEDKLEETTLFRSVSSGAQDVVIYPFSPNRIVQSILHVDQLSQRRNQVAANTNPPTLTKKRAGSGQMITIFGTKGGVGKTFLSANLAEALKRVTDQRVALLDLDLDFGNVSLNMNLLPKFTLMDVVDHIREMDAELLESFMVKHESGLMVLPANAKPQVEEVITADHIEKILHILKSTYDYVVIDMPPRFYAPVNPALNLSDLILMVTTPELSSIRNLKAALTVLTELNFPVSKIRIILNQSDLNKNIVESDVAATLNREIFASLRSDSRATINAQNVGSNVYALSPNKGLGGDIEALAKKIANVETDKKTMFKWGK